MIMYPEAEVFLENDQVREMFMLVDGECFFQLSRNMQNFKFVHIKKGIYFGALDIVGSIQYLEHEYEEAYFEEEWMEDVERLTRQFNCYNGSERAELLTFSIQDLWELKTAFFEVYEKFINMKDKREMLNRCHSLKLKATHKVEEK